MSASCKNCENPVCDNEEIKSIVENVAKKRPYYCYTCRHFKSGDYGELSVGMCTIKQMVLYNYIEFCVDYEEGHKDIGCKRTDCKFHSILPLLRELGYKPKECVGCDMASAKYEIKCKECINNGANICDKCQAAGDDKPWYAYSVLKALDNVAPLEDE